MPKIATKPAAGTVKTAAASKKKPWPDFTKKFGPTVRKAGVTAVPTVFLTGLAKLKIKPIHAIILLQMIACWGDKGPHPFPTRRRMRRQIGCDKRTLDRAITEMVEMGLIEKKPRYHPKRQTSNEYVLTGLIERLKPLALGRLKERKRQAKARAAAAEAE